ncbi:hypothetical protein EV714DRAFT_266928 [Schizophyllum commune]
MRKRLPRIRLSRHGLTVSAQSLAALPDAGCADPRYFSIQLRICIVGVSVVVYMLLGLHNYDTSLLARPATVARNVSHRDCAKVIHDLPADLTEGRGYYLQLADANLATVYAVSEPFEIKPRDASYPSTCINSTSTTPLPTPTCASLVSASTLLPSTPTSAYLPPIPTPLTPSANLVAGATEFEHGERRSPVWDMPDWLAFFCLGLLMF